MSRNERWEIGGRASLDVRVPVGTVEVFAEETTAIVLTIDATDADDVEVFKTGDRVTVRHPSRWGRRGRNSRIIAHVPVGTDVELSSTSGDVRLVGRLGVVRLNTATGDVQMGDAARVDMTTASGEFACGEIDGDATVSSVSGDCTMRRVGGRLDATVTSGDVRIERCDGDITIGSTSGDVRIGRCAGSDIAIRSISGDVKIGLPSGIRVEAEISTLSGRATLPEPAPAAERADRRAVRLRLKTVSGDIRVERTA
jgi:DUF4097 and DUF4098 domain-containing protein YvlB